MDRGLSSPTPSLSAPHSEREREVEGEDLREREREKHSPSKLHAQGVLASPLPLGPNARPIGHFPHGRSSSCSLLILFTHPFCCPPAPTDSIRPHLFPTVSCHSLHPLSTDHFPYRSPAQPSAFTSSDLSSFSTHRPPFLSSRTQFCPGSTLQACPHALPLIKCGNYLGPPESLPKFCSTLHPPGPDFLSFLPSNLLTLPSKTFAPDQQSLPHP